MSQPQHTYTLRKEIGFGIELAMSQLGEPHEIQIENFKSSYDLVVRITDDPLASLRAASLWEPMTITPGVLTPVPTGTRKLAVEIAAINNINASAPTVFHLPGFFRGAENARYYGVDQLDRPFTTMPFAANAGFWFQTDELPTMWQDVAGTTPVAVIDTDRAKRIDNMGTSGGFLGNAAAGSKYVSTIGNALGVVGALEFVPNGQEHLSDTIVPADFLSGDWGFFWASDQINAPGQDEYIMGYDQPNNKMAAYVNSGNTVSMDVAGETFVTAATFGFDTVMAGYGTTDGVSVRKAKFNIEAGEFSGSAGSFAGPAASSILDLGGDDGDTNNTYHGRIFELVIAKNTHNSRALWEAYTAGRYGVVWA